MICPKKEYHYRDLLCVASSGLLHEGKTPVRAVRSMHEVAKCYKNASSPIILIVLLLSDLSIYE